jgi:hypothetical protein
VQYLRVVVIVFGLVALCAPSVTRAANDSTYTIEITNATPKEVHIKEFPNQCNPYSGYIVRVRVSILLRCPLALVKTDENGVMLQFSILSPSRNSNGHWASMLCAVTYRRGVVHIGYATYPSPKNCSERAANSTPSHITIESAPDFEHP